MGLKLLKNIPCHDDQFTMDLLLPYLEVRVRPIANLVLHKSLYIRILRAIKSQSLYHRLVIKPIKVNRLPRACTVLISIPRRNTERIPLLPREFLLSNHRISTPRDNMVHGRGRLATPRRRMTSFQPFRATTEDATHCENQQMPYFRIP